jgi:hypothetical protein
VRPATPDTEAAAAPPPPTDRLTTPPAANEPAAFVCEDDVRQAVRAGQKILIGERTIVTPAARDAGEAQRVFEYADWRA